MGAWFRAHTVAVLVGAAIILVAIIATIFIMMNSTTPSAATITKVTYSQTQAGTKAVPVGVVVTSDTKIRALETLLTTYKIQPGVTDTIGESTGCVGGLTSKVALEYSDGKTAEFSTYVCGTENPAFSVAVSDLLASWAK
ncbi:MAG: hypothetical protein JJE28_02530 [Actinomycetales bacterium]|nr:hypothetical protein [Actinomycetales bacterium]